MFRNEPKTKFCYFLHQLIDQQDVRLTELCEGLCSVSMLNRIEDGTRTTNKLMQDAILSRLGICVNDYEVYLPHPEYEDWLERQGIQATFLERDYKKVDEMLETYRKKFSGERNRLEKQFYWSMKAQLLRNTGAATEEILHAFDQALHLTVPSYGTVPLNRIWLSMQEMNLVLEYIYYNESLPQAERAEELMQYILAKDLDMNSKAMIYPKLAVYLVPLLLEARETESKEEQCQAYLKALDFMDETLTILRKVGKSYYLWELLTLEDKLVRRCRKRYARLLSVEEHRKTKKQMYEIKDWMEMMRELERLFGYSKETLDDCFFLSGCVASDLAEVIHKRRKMFGLTSEQLCDGICDLKTISRLENRRTVPMRDIVYQLFGRLGLPPSYSRTDLLTDSPQVHENLRRLRRGANQLDSDKMEYLLDKMEGEVSTDLPWNKQFLEWEQLLLKSYRGEISDIVFKEELLRLLRYTLSKEAMNSEEWYLTSMEWRILCRLQDFDKTIPARYISQVYELLQRSKVHRIEQSVIVIYEFLLSKLMRMLSICEKHIQTMEFCDEGIRISLACHRYHRIYEFIYYKLRSENYQENQQEQDKRLLDKKKSLECCICLAAFCHNVHYINFCNGIINEIDNRMKEIE